MPSGHVPSSGSHVSPTRSSFPPPYSVSDSTHALEAFAEVNRALQVRNARQSMPRRVPQGPREPRVPNPEILPYRSQALKKEQVAQEALQLYPPFMHAHTNQGHEVINPRFSTASSPAVLYPGKPASHSDNIRETGRYQGYPRYTTSEEHLRPARPVLKLITPSSPQWATASGSHKRERTFQDMGYPSISMKDQSRCVIM